MVFGSPPRDKKCQKRCGWPLYSESWHLEMFKWHDKFPSAVWKETKSSKEGLHMRWIWSSGKYSYWAQSWPVMQLAVVCQARRGGPWPWLCTGSTGPPRQHWAGRQEIALGRGIDGIETSGYRSATWHLVLSAYPLARSFILQSLICQTLLRTRIPKVGATVLPI